MQGLRSGDDITDVNSRHRRKVFVGITERGAFVGGGDEETGSGMAWWEDVEDDLTYPGGFVLG